MFYGCTPLIKHIHMINCQILYLLWELLAYFSFYLCGIVASTHREMCVVHDGSNACAQGIYCFFIEVLLSFAVLHGSWLLETRDPSNHDPCVCVDQLHMPKKGKESMDTYFEFKCLESAV
jgi:hypothetical protein